MSTIIVLIPPAILPPSDSLNLLLKTFLSHPCEQSHCPPGFLFSPEYDPVLVKDRLASDHGCAVCRVAKLRNSVSLRVFQYCLTRTLLNEVINVECVHFRSNKPDKLDGSSATQRWIRTFLQVELQETILFHLLCLKFKQIQNLNVTKVWSILRTRSRI